jgi:hypothetical protein
MCICARKILTRVRSMYMPTSKHSHALVEIKNIYMLKLKSRGRCMQNAIYTEEELLSCLQAYAKTSHKPVRRFHQKDTLEVSSSGSERRRRSHNLAHQIPARARHMVPGIAKRHHVVEEHVPPSARRVERRNTATVFTKQPPPCVALAANERADPVQHCHTLRVAHHPVAHHHEAVPERSRIKAVKKKIVRVCVCVLQTARAMLMLLLLLTCSLRSSTRCSCLSGCMAPWRGSSSHIVR